MPEVTTSVTPPADNTPAATPAESSPEDVARLHKEIADLRKEAADRRVAARQAEEAKATAEKAKAEAEGRWADVIKIEKEAAAKAALDAEAARKRVTELEPYEGTVKSEVAALKQKLGDKAPPVDGLNDAQALRILRHVESLAAGPGAARTTTSGNPPPLSAGHPDLSKMNAQEVKQYFAGLKTDEVRQLAEQYGFGGSSRRNVFG